MSSGLNGKERPWGKGTPVWVRDATANDSDKSFTVPAGKMWLLKSVYVQFTATATVGNRNLFIAMSNATPAVLAVSPRTSFAASQTCTMMWADNAVQGTTVASLCLENAVSPTATNYVGMLPSGGLPMLAGYSLRVYDTAAIDAKADDMTVVLHYVEYDA